MYYKKYKVNILKKELFKSLVVKVIVERSQIFPLSFASVNNRIDVFSFRFDNYNVLVYLIPIVL